MAKLFYGIGPSLPKPGDSSSVKVLQPLHESNEEMRTLQLEDIPEAAEDDAALNENSFHDSSFDAELTFQSESDFDVSVLSQQSTETENLKCCKDGFSRMMNAENIITRKDKKNIDLQSTISKGAVNTEALVNGVSSHTNKFESATMVFDNEESDEDDESFNLGHESVDGHREGQREAFLSAIPEHENASFEKQVRKDAVYESRLLDALPAATIETQTGSGWQEIDVLASSKGCVKRDEVKLFSNLFLGGKKSPDPEVRPYSGRSSSDSAFDEIVRRRRSQEGGVENHFNLSDSSVPVLEFSDEDDVDGDDDEVLTQSQWQNILRSREEEHLESGHFSLTNSRPSFEADVSIEKKKILSHTLTSKTLLDAEKLLKVDDGKSGKLWKTDQIDPLSLRDWSSPMFAATVLPNDGIDAGNFDTVVTRGVKKVVVDTLQEDNGDSSSYDVPATKDPNNSAYAKELVVLFKEEVGSQVVEDDVWQKVIHVPIPDLSPPMSPVQGSACSCCDPDRCNHSIEESPSRTGTLRSNDFSPTVRE